MALRAEAERKLAAEREAALKAQAQLREKESELAALQAKVAVAAKTAEAAARAEAERKKLADELAALKAEAEDRAGAAEAAEAAREVKEAELAAVSDAANRTQAEREALSEELAKLRAEAEVKAEAARATQSERDSKTTELAVLQAEMEGQQKAIGESRREFDAKEQELAAFRAEIEAKLDAEREAVTKAQTDIEARREQLAALQAETERKAQESQAELSRQRAALESERAEIARWEAIKESDEVADFEVFLDLFPDGKLAALAKNRRKELARLALIPDIDFGRYHALVIGIDDYEYLDKLTTAVNDAEAVARVLKDDYGFEVTLLLNSTRSEIIDALDDYRESLHDMDNLLVYYAGHGWLDEGADRGFWLPTNARLNRRSNWVSNATITDTLKGLEAKHVMVVADSCYSGTLTRGTEDVGVRNEEFWERMVLKRTACSMVARTPVTLWAGRLSMTTMSAWR